MKQLPLGVRLADRARFESFVPGGNAAALAAVRELSAPGAAGVVYLHGPPASGRSHLLQAACAARGDAGYFPLAELAALGPEVLEGAGTLGCVAIDDLQRVAGDPAWERALFFVWREVEAHAGALLVAADAPPAVLGLGLRDLSSRLAAAAVHGLVVLDEVGQREALRLRASLRGLELPDETATWLLRRYPRDMGSLLALLERLDTAALSAQRRLTIPFIRQALSSPP